MGTVNVGSIVVTQDSLAIDQLTNVDAAAPNHNDVIMYNDNAIDGAYTDGWHAKPILVESLGNVDSDAAPVHNEIMVWNDNATDPAYATAWVNKDITSVFSNLETIVQSIANVQNAVITAKKGDISITDHVMFTDTVAATGTVNVAVASCEDNNALYKKEVADTDFIFVQNLTKGQIVNLTYTAGTFFRSDKGVTGFSGPFPSPLCPSSFALKEARFYISEASATITVVSMGTEVVVNLFQSDGTTVEDGPVTITGYNIATLTASASGEYFIQATGFVTCGIVETGNTNLRPVVPMSTELIGYNRNCFITAQETGTTVTYHRRNSNTGTIAVSAGTSVDGTGTFGNTADFAPGGAIILRADNPISARLENDSAGNQAIGLWPVDQLAQCFPIPSTIGTDADYGVACIAAVSKYLGSADVYDNTGTLVTTFTLTRAGALTPPATVDDQLFPASGRWKPSDEGVPADLVGGYVVTTVPAMCIANLSGDAVWTSGAGDEIALSGSTPEDIRAEIRIDAGGLARRRDIDNTGAVTWTLC